MTNTRCEQVEELLVDLVDGQLPDDERRQVDEHLANCEPCRKLLAALRESQGLAQAVWQEACAPVVDLQPADVMPRSRPVPFYVGAAAAAAILLALLSVFAWRALVAPSPQSNPDSAVSPQPLMATHPQSPTPEQIRRDVAAAGASTALLASVDWLAEQPGNREIAREQYEFITHMYAGTEVASQAQARLAALQQRRS